MKIRSFPFVFLLIHFIRFLKKSHLLRTEMAHNLFEWNEEKYKKSERNHKYH